MSKPYQDKESGKWKWGTRGQAIYETKDQCSRAGMEILTDKLRSIRERLNGTLLNHGK